MTWQKKTHQRFPPQRHPTLRLAEASAACHGAPRQVARGAAEVGLPAAGAAQEAAHGHVGVAEDVVEKGEANAT